MWRVAPGGGDPVKLTTLPGGVNDFAWAPDGKTLYLVSDVKWPPMQEIDRRTDEYPDQRQDLHVAVLSSLE